MRIVATVNTSLGCAKHCICNIEIEDMTRSATCVIDFVVCGRPAPLHENDMFNVGQCAACIIYIYSDVLPLPAEILCGDEQRAMLHEART